MNEPPRRIPSLDGLRGIAAVVVVVHHSLLTSPAFARAYGGASSGVTGLAWWLSYTPAHLVWGGTEAVFVFFVLSGFVLTLQTSSVRFHWAAYYPSRILRLYLPVVAAVVFAALMTVGVKRHTVAGASWFLNAHDVPTTFKTIVQNMTLMHVTFLDGPLWSLKWEVAFSLLLPLFIVSALLLGRGRRMWVTSVLLLVLIPIGIRTGFKAFEYLPMFGLGVLMAADRDRFSRLAPTRAVGSWLLIFVGGLLLSARWWTHASSARSYLLIAPEALGAALIVYAFTYCVAAARLGEARPTQWLGRRSFSLYLIHEPIVVSVALLLGGRANALITLALAFPLSLLLADIFFRLIEAPSHRLAQRVGRRARSRVA